jgi:colicin import membrane protein
MNDLTKKSVEELKKLEEESRAELFALRFQSAMGNLEKPHRIGELKKQIARILTILSVSKNYRENTAINVKVNLNETYFKIKKESQVLAKQRKVKIEQMMSEQQSAEGEMPSLMDLPLNGAIDSTEEAVKSVILDKADIRGLKGTKKAELTKTTKKTAKLNVKEKLATIKSFVVMGGVTKERDSGVKIDLELKAKDLNTKECTYGTNLKENRDKILTAGKTTKNPITKQLRKEQGKNNGKK